MNESTRGEEPCRPNGYGLCTTHPTCEHVRRALKEAQFKVVDQTREIRVRGEILNVLAKNIGEAGNCWMNAAEIDWRQRLRDFAEDSEQHAISYDAWKSLRGNGITLYAAGGFFTAYYEDAAEVWTQADDTRPMFHVMVQSDPPHRTAIHPVHLVAWVEHFAEIFLPVQILSGECLMDG